MPDVLWRPSAEQVRRAGATRFAQAVGLPDRGDYRDLLAWSVADVGRFWSAFAEFAGVRWHERADEGLSGDVMPGARFFPGATLSHPEHVFADRDPDAIALRAVSELRPGEVVDWSWARLRAETARVREGLLALGVGRGDRVAAYLPHVPETVAAFLATASLGAIWSCAAPEFGVDAVVARFAQIEPSVFLSVDGYRYRGRDQDRREPARRIAETLGAPHVVLGHLDGTGWPDPVPARASSDLSFEVVGFDHPLWVLYSSGTTGLPKAIVHGHGGVLLEQLKTMTIQMDVHRDDRFSWFTTTGWVMWNVGIGALTVGAADVLYDGFPDADALWDMAAATGVTLFGTSAGFLDGCRRADLHPAAGRDLSALRSIGSTGSPLAPECFDWVYDRFPASTWLFSSSGGTDVASGFLGAAPTVPVYRGELGPAALGVDLHAYSPTGESLVGEVGELVVRRPMPSMPLGFWNDPGGARYRETYFAQFPGVWCHGDWLELTPRGTGIISGRSDATINRGGVRIGSGEVYRALLAVPEVADALVVDVDGVVVLFVVPSEGQALDDALRTRIVDAVRTGCSPRHVPDEVVAVADVPRTSSGKKLEVPIKRILAGADPEGLVSRSALANPEALDAFVALAAARRPGGGAG